MPTFTYKAMDRAGKEIRGSLAADSAAAARKQLRGRNLHPTQLRSVGETAHAGGAGFSRWFQAQRRRDLLEFTRQLATMIGAEIKLTEALGVLISQSGSNGFSQVLQNLRDQLVSGESFADALKEFPDWFDPMYISMVRVGEVTGNLGKALTLLGDYMGKRIRLEAKFKSALIYPVILIVMATLVTLFLMLFLVPRITNILVESGQNLPWITEALMTVSQGLVRYWLVLLIVVVALGWLLKRSLATERGRMAFDRMLLHLPIMGELIRQSIVARFTATLAALIRTGMPMADGLQVVCGVTGNAVLAQAVREARERIIAGADVATPLQESRVVSPAVAHMIAVGERTGELEKMLLTIAENLEETSDLRIQRMTSLVEPLIIVLVAGIVGIIVLATVLPIMQITDLSKL